MKFVKAQSDILLEALHNPAVHGRKCDLFCSYIGAVEIAVGKDEDGYVSDLYIAVQLPTGEILAVDENNKVFSLSNEMFIIHWGYYPVDFPEEQKTKRKPPKAFAPWEYIDINPEGITTIDQLPF